MVVYVEWEDNMFLSFEICCMSVSSWFQEAIILLGTGFVKKKKWSHIIMSDFCLCVPPLGGILGIWLSNLDFKVYFKWEPIIIPKDTILAAIMANIEISKEQSPKNIILKKTIKNSLEDVYLHF